jgi:hypothetical protein
MISDRPLLIRGSSDLLLFSISTIYIIHNRLEINIENIENIEKHEKILQEP